MRAFIAVPVSPEAVSEVCRVQKKLAQSNADVKWVAERNVHLTLEFLGEISGQEKEKVMFVLDRIASAFKPFSAALSSPGAFPTASSPRVVWIGVEEGAQELTACEKKLREALKLEDIQVDEKPFHPHLTLGRVRSSLNRKQLSRGLQETPVQKVLFSVGCLTLFQSLLSPTGPVYDAVHISPLSGK